MGCGRVHGSWIVAHGRRGYADLWMLEGSWFTAGRGVRMCRSVDVLTQNDSHYSLLTTDHSQSDHLIPFDEIRFKDIMVSLLNIGIDQVDVVLRALKFKLMPVCL